MCWSALADAVPIYPLYALLFADSGLSGAQISLLLAVWSVVGVVAEVPSGAWADRHSRRAALVAAGVFQAAGYVLWVVLPGMPGFAAGFALWGVGGAMASGSFPALVYDGLAACDAQGRYATLMGRAEAAALLVQVPVAGAASVLFALGGYELAGWVSVGMCLVAAAVAATLPEGGRPAGPCADAEDGACGARRALAGAAASRAVLAALGAVAALAAFDGLEEYTPLIAADWGVTAAAVPLAIVAIPLTGAAGAALGGRGAAASPGWPAAAMLVGAAALAASALAAHPSGIAGVALFYGLLRFALVIADARLQEAITGPSRATVTSLAGVGAELASLLVYGAWAIGGLGAVTAMAVALAVALVVAARRPGYPRVSAVRARRPRRAR